MTKETGGKDRNGQPGNGEPRNEKPRNGKRGDPNQDVQPWLGWIAAMLVVVIVVVAVAMGMERTGNQRDDAAEVRMTPLVGGMALPVTTEESDYDAAAEVAEVTPVPEAMTEGVPAVTETTEIVTGTASAVITGTEAVTGTDGVTPTEEMTGTEEMTETGSPTAAMSVTETVTGSETEAVTATVAVTATNEVTVETTTEPTLTPAPSPTSSATATTRPTVTPTIVAQVFEPGENIVANEERVDLYADVSLEAMVLDSFGVGTELEVLVPSGDYSSYPVVADGHGWARVRAADGLVGWVMTHQVEAQ